MDVHVKQMIEAALDPKGKWYGLHWPEQPAERALAVAPVGQAETVAEERDAEAASWEAEPTRPSRDEWDPA
ncbi:MAG TPA: hypothetical protein VGP33_06945 [Chloroflexota bacterium]|nr:hypothetical protein [Chloroflexota bacterium]